MSSVGTAGLRGLTVTWPSDVKEALHLNAASAGGRPDSDSQSATARNSDTFKFSRSVNPFRLLCMKRNAYFYLAGIIG